VPQERADRELRGQAAGEVGQEGHRVVEGGVRALLDGSGRDRAGDGPDQPAAERRRSVACGPHHAGEVRVLTGQVGQERVPQEVRALAEGEVVEPARGGRQCAQDGVRSRRVHGGGEGRGRLLTDELVGERHGVSFLTGRTWQRLRSPG
jgi:hypothetical protein